MAASTIGRLTGMVGGRKRYFRVAGLGQGSITRKEWCCRTACEEADRGRVEYLVILGSFFLFFCFGNTFTAGQFTFRQRVVYQLGAEGAGKQQVCDETKLFHSWRKSMRGKVKSDGTFVN